MIEKVRRLLTAICCFFLISNTIAAKCQRNGTHIVCEQRSTSNPLYTIRGDISNVDTIIVHRAKLDLTEDLFDNDQTLPRVNFFNASDNEIERIGRRGFDKIHNVEYLYLSQNLISHSQPDPFMSLTRLQKLEMNNALAGSSSEKEKLLKTFFVSKNEFADLNDISLNDNGLDITNPRMFCGVSGLIRLELNNNNIGSLDFTRKCFNEMKALFVSANKITKIPTEIWEWMPSLTSLDISNNPLHCDCSIAEFISADGVSFINQGNTICASPSEFKGKNVFDLPKGFCRREGGKNMLFNFIVLTIIAVVVFFLYKKYRQKQSFSSKPVGYHNLDHELAVEPEFV